MDNRLMIATIGYYQHERLDYAIARRPIAKIVIIHSSDKRSKDAAKRIKRKYGSDIVECCEKDPWDYETLLTIAMTIPERYPGLIPEYHIGLGTRVMTMALAMAALFTGSKMYIVIEDEEKTMRNLKMIQMLPFKTMQIQKRIFLEVLDKAGEHGFKSKTDWKNAARERLDIHHQNSKYLTIIIGNSNRHLNQLITWEFAQIGHLGNSHIVTITALGKAVLELKNVRRQLWSQIH